MVMISHRKTCIEFCRYHVYGGKEGFMQGNYGNRKKVVILLGGKIWYDRSRKQTGEESMKNWKSMRLITKILNDEDIETKEVVLQHVLMPRKTTKD